MRRTHWLVVRYTDANTVTIDAFLMDDDELAAAQESGELPTEYCLDCGSHRTEPLRYISHSASRAQLRRMFSKEYG